MSFMGNRVCFGLHRKCGTFIYYVYVGRDVSIFPSGD